MLKRTLQVLAGAAACLVIASAAQAGSCKQNFIQGSNGSLLTGHDRALSVENAISVWELRAISSAGPDWKDWPKSANRTTRCFRNNFKRWKCTVRARPCQS